MVQDAIDIKVLQTLIPERKRHGYRSAGACPPRSLNRNEKRPQPRGHGRFLPRSMHGEGQALALRWQEGLLGDVARGPVSRERSVV